MASRANRQLWTPWRLAGWGGAAALLLLPLAANAPWTASDFIAMGGLLLATGGLIELGVWISPSRAYRAAAAIAAVTALLIIWVSLAVGIIGSEDHPANLMFFAVLGLTFVAVSLTGFRASRLSRVLTATAVGQALVPLVALAIWMPPFTVGVAKVLVLNLFFVGLWLLSAGLFRKAAREPPAGA